MSKRHIQYIFIENVLISNYPFKQIFVVKNLILILFLLPVNLIFSQVSVDTISTNYYSYIENGEKYYAILKEDGDTLILRQLESERLVISRNKLEETCQLDIKSVEDRQDESILFSKDQTLYLLNSDCETIAIDTSRLYNSFVGTNIVNFSKKDSIVCLYDKDGNIIKTFDDVKDFSTFNKQYFGIVTFSQMDSIGRKRLFDKEIGFVGIRNVYDANGDLVVKSVRKFKTFSNQYYGVSNSRQMDSLKMLNIYHKSGEFVGTSMGDVKAYDEIIYYRDMEDEWHYYFDNKAYQLPKDFKRLRLQLNKDLVVQFNSGLSGIYDKSLNEIIPPNYTQIYYIRWDPKVVSHNVTITPDKDIFAAVDPELNLDLYYTNGSPVGLDFKFENMPRNLPMHFFRINGEVKFIAISSDKRTFHLYDVNFNYLDSVTKDVTNKYCLEASMQGFPVEFLKYIITDPTELGFFDARVDKVFRRNIIDRNFKPVLKKDVSYIEKIDNDHFIISNSFSAFNSLGKTGYVIKLSYQ